MDPTGPHSALDRLSLEHLEHLSHVPHVDHTLAQSVIAALAFTTPVAMMVADTAIRLISSAVVTLVTSLIVGWVNRRMAIRELRREVQRATLPPPPPAPPAG
jgi:hypothetical protein